MTTQSFRDLIVWQKSRDLAVKVYKATESFPKSESYGLTSQMRRAVISISSNGSHLIQVKAIDSQGNTATNDIHIGVNQPYATPTPTPTPTP